MASTSAQLGRIPKNPMPVIPLTRSELADLIADILSQRDAE
jgi:hypothetical protein